MNVMDCITCQKEFEYKDTYGEARCPHCGQGYEYDEGQRIVLTESQVAMLICENDIEEITAWARKTVGVIKRCKNETKKKEVNDIKG